MNTFDKLRDFVPGKTIAEITAPNGEAENEICIEFTDGSRMVITACLHGLAYMDYELVSKPTTT